MLQCLNVGLVDLQRSWFHHVTQVLNFFLKEVALVNLEGNACFRECGQRLVDMDDVIVLVIGIDDDVVWVYQTGFPLVFR